MVVLTDMTVDILRDYIDAYCDADDNTERLIIAARLVGALDMALATAGMSEVKRPDCEKSSMV